jgi:putative salt-induced outer membrane protein YdiY
MRVGIWMMTGMAAALATATAAAADEIVFTNGDRLTGTVTGMKDGTLSIDSEVAGTIGVSLEAVRTFSTDAPIAIYLDDGTVLRDVVHMDEDGRVRTAGDAETAAQPVPFARVDAINPPYGRWRGSVSAGGTVTRGNSETESVHAGAAARRRTEYDRITLAGEYLFTSQENDDGSKETTADYWGVRGKYDYFVTEKLYPFAAMVAERDRIADLDLRLIPSAGLGYQWVEREDLSFLTEAGLAWVYEEYRNGDSDERISARVAYAGSYRPREGVTLFHDMEVFPSLEDIGDFNLIANGGVRVSLVASLFTELKAQWRHDQTPAEDAERNDYRYLMSLGWSFD